MRKIRVTLEVTVEPLPLEDLEECADGMFFDEEDADEKAGFLAADQFEDVSAESIGEIIEATVGSEHMSMTFFEGSDIYLKFVAAHAVKSEWVDNQVPRP